MFELRKRGSDWFVGIDYVTQTLLQMRTRKNSDQPVRIAVECPETPCELRLDRFNMRVLAAIGSDTRYLSRCENGDQRCGPPLTAARSSTP